MPAKQKSPKEEAPFEKSMERLEAIVEEMESAELPLEDLIARYEEGVKLVEVCSEKLDSAEKRIQVITRNAKGEETLEAFDPSATAPPPEKPLNSEKDPDEISLF